MDQIVGVFNTLTTSHYVAIAWAVIVLVILLILVFREKFAGFQSTKMATQLPPSQLGIGAGARFQQEFGSTNQSETNVFARAAGSAKEHLTGYGESPYFGDTPKILEDYNSTAEGFESVDQKLSQLLH